MIDLMRFFIEPDNLIIKEKRPIVRLQLQEDNIMDIKKEDRFMKIGKNDDIYIV